MDPRMKKEVEDLVKQTLEKEFDKLYRKIATKYGVSDTPLHNHNGIDAPLIPNSSLSDFLTVPANGNGVFSPNGIGIPDGNNGQSVNDNSIGIPPHIFVPQTPIIYGHGVGAWSQFNGGDAPQGTMLFFDNGATISGLWIKTVDGTWRGTAADAFNRTA